MSLLLGQREELKPGDHLLSIYGTPEERVALLLPFLEMGLERGERCLYIPGGDAEQVLEALEKSGLSIPRFVTLGQMGILNPQETIEGGPLAAKFVLERIIASAERAKSEGFRGLRVAWEAGLVLRELSGPLGGLGHEAGLSDLCRHHRTTVLCQYDRRSVPEETLLQALRAHPRVVVGRRLCRNLYYLPFNGYPPEPGQELDLQLKRVLEQEILTGDLQGQVQRSARRADELAVLNAIATVISHSLDLSLILNDALDAVLAVLEVEAGHIRLVDEATGDLVLLISRGRSEAFVKGRARIRWEESLLAPLQASGEALVIADLQEEREIATFCLAFAEGFRSYAAIPLIVQGRIIGTLSFLSRSVGKFQPEDIPFLAAIGHQLGIAVEQARLDQELRQNLEKIQQYAANLEKLYKAGIRVSASLDLDQTLRFIVQSAVEATGASSSTLILFEGSGRTAQVTVWDPSGALEGKCQSGPDGISRKVVKTGKLWMIQDFSLEPSGLVNPELIQAGRKAGICLPLQFQDRVGGVMWIHYDAPRAFSEEEIHLLSSFATQAALAVEHARLFEATQGKARQLEALFETTKLLASTYRLEEAFRLLAEVAVRVTGAAGCLIFSVDEEGRLVLRVTAGQEAISGQDRLFDEGILSGLCSQVIQENRPLILDDRDRRGDLLAQDLKERGRFGPLLGVPVQIRGKVLGVIITIFPSSFDSWDEVIDLLSTIARLAAIAVEDTRLLTRSALLQEVHHRVKNNLQTVAGLLYLQQTYCRPQSGKIALQESIARIRSIAAVHDLLSLDNLGLTRVKELFQKIIELFLVEGNGRRKIQASVE